MLTVVFRSCQRFFHRPSTAKLSAWDSLSLDATSTGQYLASASAVESGIIPSDLAFLEELADDKAGIVRSITVPHLPDSIVSLEFIGRV